MSEAQDAEASASEAQAEPRRAPDAPSPTPVLKDLALARSVSQGFSQGADLARGYYAASRWQFERKEGEIVREYWAEHAVMAVVVTGRPRARILRMLGLRPRYALHRSTEAASLPYELEAALADGDTLAAKAAEVLNGGAAVTVLNRIFEAHKFLLSAVDAELDADRNWPITIRGALRQQDGSAEPARTSMGATGTLPRPPATAG